MRFRPASLHVRRGDWRPADNLPATRHARTGRADEPTPNGTRNGKGERDEISGEQDRTECRGDETARRDWETE